MNEILRYRQLPQAEWYKLKPIFDRRDWWLPPQFIAEAAVAENDKDEIVGGEILQPVLHAEPVFTEPGYEGKVNLLHINGIIDSLINPRSPWPGYLILAVDARQEKLAEFAGLERVLGSVWRKTVKGA